jgi:hypothetical protein
VSGEFGAESVEASSAMTDGGGSILLVEDEEERERSRGREATGIPAGVVFEEGVGSEEEEESGTEGRVLSLSDDVLWEEEEEEPKKLNRDFVDVEGDDLSGADTGGERTPAEGDGWGEVGSGEATPGWPGEREGLGSGLAAVAVVVLDREPKRDQPRVGAGGAGGGGAATIGTEPNGPFFPPSSSSSSSSSMSDGRGGSLNPSVPSPSPTMTPSPLVPSEEADADADPPDVKG